MYCNAPPGGYMAIRLTSGGNGSIAQPVISSATTTLISGTAPANCTIEVFQAQDGAALACGTTDVHQGAVYLGTTTSNAGGTWSLAGSFCGYITATATDATNNTSRFATRSFTGVTCSVPVNCVVRVLPLQIENFMAQYEEEQVRLSWELSNHELFKKLYVQYSADGYSWNEIEEMNIITPKQYTYTKHFQKGINFYRILGVGKDGQHTYSHAVSVETNPLQNKLFVYPSLLQVGDRLKISNAGNFVRIYDIMGNIVHQIIPHLDVISEWNTSNVPSGMYIIQTQNGVQKIQIID